MPDATCLERTAAPQGANLHLHERLADALEELDAAHAQLRILQGLQQQLEEGVPGAAELAAAALEQERALQAARDARVLQLLKAKVRVWGVVLFLVSLLQYAPSMNIDSTPRILPTAPPLSHPGRCDREL